MNNFLKRALTGGFFGILVFGSLFAGSIYFLLFYNILMAVSLLEFYKMTGRKVNPVQKWFAVLASVLIFVILFGYLSGILSINWLPAIAVFPVVIMIVQLYGKRGESFKGLAWTFFGMIYVSLPLIMLNFLVFPGNIPYSGYYPDILAGVFILIMINDTAAYLVGVPFGRHRLFKSVSPKKSWEGFAGGAVFVIAASLVMHRIFPVPDVTGWFLIGLIVAVFGVYGDLVESMFKRSLDIKDSGSILPGHGGVLDRIDAWLFVIPLVWILMNFIH